MSFLTGSLDILPGGFVASPPGLDTGILVIIIRTALLRNTSCTAPIRGRFSMDKKREAKLPRFFIPLAFETTTLR